MSTLKSTPKALATALADLSAQLDGQLRTTELDRMLYATDASIFRIPPLAIATPRSTDDVQQIVRFCAEHAVPLTPRGGGTSLAGQAIGPGIIVDLSRHFTAISRLDLSERHCTVEPGVVRDDLNRYLKPHGLFFAPETSTANRATIGGMIGNNSCGANSITYGSTRDHLISLQSVFSDGSVQQVEQNTLLQAPPDASPLFSRICNELISLLSPPDTQTMLADSFAHPAIHRRNSGYALDLISRGLNQKPPTARLTDLLCGSEATLALSTRAKVALQPLPPDENALIAVHCRSIAEACEVALIARSFSPTAVELFDAVILNCTRSNAYYNRLRFFVQGDPEALVVIELRDSTTGQLLKRLQKLQGTLQRKKLGYAWPLIEKQRAASVWELRKAGLGLLANTPGDSKPVAVVEDIAVRVEDQQQFMQQYGELMQKMDVTCVFYGHIGDGEIHLRPILNIKTRAGQAQLSQIATEAALLVKKFRGSLSGEHGDGRVRAPYLPALLGEAAYELCQKTKQLFDPAGIFNPGSIISDIPITTHLRYPSQSPRPQHSTLQHFSDSESLLQLVEKCNGTAVCRKSAGSGGLMCPSFQASADELHSTRGRANVFREVLTNQPRNRAFSSPLLAEALDLCISCKGCLSECPSNIDMAAYKAEWLHQRHRRGRGLSLQTLFFAYTPLLEPLACRLHWISNPLLKNRVLHRLVTSVLQIHPQRPLPGYSSKSGYSLVANNQLRSAPHASSIQNRGHVYLFCDEFTDYHDAGLYQKTIALLNHLEISTKVLKLKPSGRAAISKGMLGYARHCASANVRRLHGLISADRPLIGLEPSAILSFRDEYPRLVPASLRKQARELATHVYLLEEYLLQRLKDFPALPRKKNPPKIVIHDHCHAKALAESRLTEKVLRHFCNATIQTIASGCCGMAGSFGYEKKHYAFSKKIAGLTLLPALAAEEAHTLIVAHGFSCRHQIADLAGKQAIHPVQLLFAWLSDNSPELHCASLGG